jgi:hypothetical protein
MPGPADTPLCPSLAGAPFAFVLLLEPQVVQALLGFVGVSVASCLPVRLVNWHVLNDLDRHLVTDGEFLRSGLG